MLANGLDVRILLHCNLEIRKISHSAFNKNNDNIHRIRMKIIVLFSNFVFNSIVNLLSMYPIEFPLNEVDQKNQ